MLSPEAPYPIQGGGALRTASLLHFLARDHDVDLIVFREALAPDPAAALPPGLVREIHVINLPHHSKSQAARLIRNAARLARGIPPLVERFSGFGSEIARATQGRHYEIAVAEHFWCAPYLPQLSAVSDRTVLDLHNIESVLHEGCAEHRTMASGIRPPAFRAHLSRSRNEVASPVFSIACHLRAGRPARCRDRSGNTGRRVSQCPAVDSRSLVRRRIRHSLLWQSRISSEPGRGTLFCAANLADFARAMARPDLASDRKKSRRGGLIHPRRLAHSTLRASRRCR